MSSRLQNNFTFWLKQSEAQLALDVRLCPADATESWLACFVIDTNSLLRRLICVNLAASPPCIFFNRTGEQIAKCVLASATRNIFTVESSMVQRIDDCYD
jgi:hypothetical protein